MNVVPLEVLYTAITRTIRQMNNGGALDGIIKIPRRCARGPSSIRGRVLEESEKKKQACLNVIHNHTDSNPERVNVSGRTPSIASDKPMARITHKY